MMTATIGDAEIPPPGELADPDEAELRAGDLGRLFGFLKPYFTPYRRTLALLGCLLLLHCLFNVAFPLATQHLVDDGLIGRDWDVLVLIMSFLGVAAVGVSFVSIINNYYSARLAADIVMDVRTSLFEHVQRLPMPYFQRTPSGQTLSRFSGDVVATETLLVHLMPSMVIPLLEVISSTALMFYFNPWLGLIGLTVFPMILIGPRAFSRRAFELSYEKRLREADLLSLTQENVQAQPVVKAFGLRQHMIDTFRARNADWLRFAFRMNFFSALAESTAHMGVYLVHVVILALGAYWAFHDVISIGTLVAFEAMFVSMGYALTDLTQFVPTLAQASGSIEHLNQVLQEKPSLEDFPDASPLPRMADCLAVEDVTFRYSDGREALQNISFQVPKNFYLAIVGRSGSGKSTLLSLLLRFYDPTSGRVTIDGHDIRFAQQGSLREQIGIVFQDSQLFNVSILDNIRMGKRDASLAEVEAALRSAEVWDFVESLPGRPGHACRRTRRQPFRRPTPTSCYRTIARS